jgi:hypothetical protein
MGMDTDSIIWLSRVPKMYFVVVPAFPSVSNRSRREADRP